MRRKWNLKRLACLSLAGIMALGTFTGCGNSTGSKDNGGKKTLVVGIPQNSDVLDHNDVTFTTYVEENLNIDLEFVTFSYGEEEELVNEQSKIVDFVSHNYNK